MSITNLALSTELEAVNVMLGTVGMPAITTLSGTLTPEITSARTLLEHTSRTFQALGWHFNTEYEVSLTPDVNDKISTLGMARVDLPTSNHVYNVTVRGAFLYDLKTHSFAAFTNGAIKATVTYWLSWDDLPQPARDYITIKAARKFQTDIIGSETLDGFTNDDEFTALSNFKDFDGDAADDSIFDNYDVAAVIDRYGAYNQIL